MWRLMDCKIIAGDDVVTHTSPGFVCVYAEEDKIVVRNTIKLWKCRGRAQPLHTQTC